MKRQQKEIKEDKKETFCFMIIKHNMNLKVLKTKYILNVITQRKRKYYF